MQRGRGKAKGRDPALTNHTKMVQWASSLLDTRYRKIGDLLHSHLFCQLFDASAPGKVNMHKVRWEPISDAQHLENFRVLQDAFAKAGVQRRIEFDALMKGRYSACLELLQIIRIYYANNADPTAPYDPLARRKLCKNNASKRRRPARQRNRSAAGGPRNNSRKSSPISFHSLPSPNRGSGGGAGGGPGDGAGRHASHGRRSRRDSDQMRYISKRPAALDTRNPYDASTAGTRTAMSNHSTAADLERPYSAYNDEDSAALFQFHPTMKPKGAFAREMLDLGLDSLAKELRCYDATRAQQRQQQQLQQQQQQQAALAAQNDVFGEFRYSGSGGMQADDAWTPHSGRDNVVGSQADLLVDEQQVVVPSVGGAAGVAGGGGAPAGAASQQYGRYGYRHTPAEGASGVTTASSATDAASVGSRASAAANSRIPAPGFARGNTSSTISGASQGSGPSGSARGAALSGGASVGGASSSKAWNSDASLQTIPSTFSLAFEKPTSVPVIVPQASFRYGANGRLVRKATMPPAGLASVAEEPSAAAASTQAQAGAGGGVAGAAPAAAEAGPGFDLNLYRAPDKVAAWARGNNGKPDGSKAASGGSEALTALEAERRRMSPDSAGTGGGAGGGSGANIQPGGVRTGMRGGGYAKRSGGAGAAPASTRRKSKAQRSSGYAERHSPRKGFRGGPPGGAAAAGSQRQVVDLGSSYTTLTADEEKVMGSLSSLDDRLAKLRAAKAARVSPATSTGGGTDTGATVRSSPSRPANESPRLLTGAAAHGGGGAAAVTGRTIPSSRRAMVAQQPARSPVAVPPGGAGGGYATGYMAVPPYHNQQQQPPTMVYPQPYAPMQQPPQQAYGYAQATPMAGYAPPPMQPMGAQGPLLTAGARMMAAPPGAGGYGAGPAAMMGGGGGGFAPATAYLQ